MSAAPLYRRLLGEAAWFNLPPAVRGLHDGVNRAEGVATVERGHSVLSHLAAAAVGFPPAATAVPVSVRIEAEGEGERWVRTFGRHTLSSRQWADKGALMERIGVVSFAMALTIEGDRLRLALRRWSLFGLRLPLWLAPRSTVYEAEDRGAFRFFVEVRHPLCGLIVRYQGTLTPQEAPAAKA